MSMKGEELAFHGHGSFAGADMNLIGGHVKRMIVSATTEMQLQVLSMSMKRKFDEEIGLHLLSA